MQPAMGGFGTVLWVNLEVLRVDELREAAHAGPYGIGTARRCGLDNKQVRIRCGISGHVELPICRAPRDPRRQTPLHFSVLRRLRCSPFWPYLGDDDLTLGRAAEMWTFTFWVIRRPFGGYGGKLSVLSCQEKQERKTTEDWPVATDN